MYLESIKQDSEAIKYIDHYNKDFCLKAIKQNATVIKYIKNPTEEMCLLAVTKNGEVIEYIKNPSEDVCLAAVKQNGSAIEYISKKNQSFDIVQAFFDCDWNKLKYRIKKDYYEYLTKKFITKEQAMIMIEDNVENIYLVSSKVQKELIKIKPELKKYLNKEEVKDIDNNFFRKN